MPVIYLSPSTQEFNEYINGGSEEEYMNLIADAMIPYLESSGINYTRNTPEMTAGSSIRASNSGNYDLHLAIHSNSSGPELAGALMGSDVYYYPGSVNGQRAAQIVADNLKNIYPYPELVDTRATTNLGEVRRTKAPSVLVEVAYHDNPEDAQWIKNNIETIAENIVYSLTEYFGIPFVYPQPTQEALVNVTSGVLNLRSRPSIYANILTTLDDGQQVTVLGSLGDWYLINADGITGYVSAPYINIID